MNRRPIELAVEVLPDIRLRQPGGRIQTTSLEQQRPLGTHFCILSIIAAPKLGHAAQTEGIAGLVLRQVVDSGTRPSWKVSRVLYRECVGEFWLSAFRVKKNPTLIVAGPHIYSTLAQAHSHVDGFYQAASSQKGIDVVFRPSSKRYEQVEQSYFPACQRRWLLSTSCSVSRIH